MWFYFFSLVSSRTDSLKIAAYAPISVMKVLSWGSFFARPMKIMQGLSAYDAVLNAKIVSFHLRPFISASLYDFVSEL